MYQPGMYIFFNIKSQTKRTLDDIMYEDECRRYALAFDGQGSYSVNLLITLIFIKLFIFFSGILFLFEIKRIRNQKYNMVGWNDFEKIT